MIPAPLVGALRDLSILAPLVALDLSGDPVVTFKLEGGTMQYLREDKRWRPAPL